MAKKRFTDIEIWDKEWYMELKPKHKCLMKYMFDKCDACGCWKPNWKLASTHINEVVEFSDLSSLPKDQYEVLPNGKIFIPDFIHFQYGKLSKNSPAHNPVFIALEKNNLTDRVFNRVLDNLQATPKEEGKDKEEYKEKESEPENGIIQRFVSVFKEINKGYFIDKSEDYRACMDIAKKIADWKGFTQNSITNGKMEDIVSIWKDMVEFAQNDPLFRKMAIKNFNSQFQLLHQKFTLQEMVTNKPKKMVI